MPDGLEAMLLGFLLPCWSFLQRSQELSDTEDSHASHQLKPQLHGMWVVVLS